MKTLSKFFLIILLCVIAQASAQKQAKVQYFGNSTHIIISYEGEKAQASDSLDLYFTGLFNKDTIKVNYGHQTVFNGIISPNRSGLAKYLRLKIKPEVDTIEIWINNSPFEIKKFEGYLKMYLGFNKDTLHITISNRQHYFQ